MGNMILTVLIIKGIIISYLLMIDLTCEGFCIGTVKYSISSTSSSSSSSLFLSNDNKDKDKDNNNKNNVKKKISFELRPSINHIPPGDWNLCLTEESSPFLQHSWLSCLEKSGCASPETGWTAQPLVLQIDGITRGYVPLYIKTHSMGEFIFDSSWADAAYQLGIQYYPKLLVAVPFTPVTGQRILLHPHVWETFQEDEISQIRRAVANFLLQLAESNHLSSVHINFSTDAEATALSTSLLPLSTMTSPYNKPNSLEEPSESNLSKHVKDILSRVSAKRGTRFLRRTSLQYHWTNENPNNDGKPYSSFDEYLLCFKSKRRIKIKRERRAVLEDSDVQIDIIVGTDILKYQGLVERMFELYLSTVDKMIWGRQYLTMEFFQHLANSTFLPNLCFLCARKKSTGKSLSTNHMNKESNNPILRAEDVFAGTINIVHNGVFYGRYWGCLPGREVKNLHFEICYWSAIEFCIQNDIQRMEPGAGGGGTYNGSRLANMFQFTNHFVCFYFFVSLFILDYKWTRGFDPTVIHSTHYICNPGLRRAVCQFLEYETENNVELQEYLNAKRSITYKEREQSQYTDFKRN
jgi:uncharacterized protein